MSGPPQRRGRGSGTWAGQAASRCRHRRSAVGAAAVHVGRSGGTVSGPPQRRRRGGGARAGQAAQQRGVGAAATRKGAAGRAPGRSQVGETKEEAGRCALA